MELRILLPDFQQEVLVYFLLIMKGLFIGFKYIFSKTKNMKEIAKENQECIKIITNTMIGTMSWFFRRVKPGIQYIVQQYYNIP